MKGIINEVFFSKALIYTCNCNGFSLRPAHAPPPNWAQWQQDYPVEIALFSCTISHTFEVTEPDENSYWVITPSFIEWHGASIITQTEGVGNSGTFTVPLPGNYEVEMHSWGGWFGNGGIGKAFDASRETYRYGAASGGGGGGSGACLSTTSEVESGTAYPYLFNHGTVSYDYDTYGNRIIVEKHLNAFTDFGGIRVEKGDTADPGSCLGYNAYPGVGGTAGTVSGSMIGWSAVKIGQNGSDGTGASRVTSSQAVASGANGGPGGGIYGDIYGKGGSSNSQRASGNVVDDTVEPTGPAIIIYYKGH